jgi:hypothetical protein
VLSRWRIFAALAAIVLLAPGMRARVFRARETKESGRAEESSAAPVSWPVIPARLVHLEPGLRFTDEHLPEGWTDLVFKSVPRLTSGDLVTVSAGAHEIAQRIRPIMLAEVGRASADPSSPYQLRRVGVGVCAPGKEDWTDVVVSAMSVAGTRGEWTAKERLILAALSYESSRARMPAATATFALVRTPVVFLVAGRHRKLDMCYALQVDPRTGKLATIVWPDLSSPSDKGPQPAIARRLTSRVFDLPQDVHAVRALGSIPVSWSFAIRGLPDGPDLELPAVFLDLVGTADGSTPRSAAIEQLLDELVSGRRASTGGVARAGR